MNAREYAMVSVAESNAYMWFTEPTETPAAMTMAEFEAIVETLPDRVKSLIVLGAKKEREDLAAMERTGQYL